MAEKSNELTALYRKCKEFMSEISSKKAGQKRSTLLVWDAEGPAPSGDWTTILWSSFDDSGDAKLISLPRLVEEQAERYRARYLAWVYELGETRIRGKRLVDHLELKPGFSYWWMTSVAQKFNVSGISQINNAIKSMAFEEVIKERRPESILFVSGNLRLVAVISGLCSKLGLDFKWYLGKKSEYRDGFGRRLYHALPHGLQAVIYFIWYFVISFNMLCKRRREPSVLQGQITFVDILVHLDKKAFITGNFSSNYWTSLVDRLGKSGVKTNWFHHFFRHQALPTMGMAARLVDKFNKKAKGKQVHVLLESSLTFRVFFSALKNYSQTAWVSFRLFSVRQLFAPNGSSVDFWPLFTNEWYESLRGKGAAINCLRFSLYQELFTKIPYQRLGVYIQENQPWEMALIYAWKAAGHGKIVGTPHSTVRFWDLRYFFDPRTYGTGDANELPVPDLVAVNGPWAKTLYVKGGYPEGQIVDVEALRYLHLTDITARDHRSKKDGKNLNVLVCGDFLPATTQRMLSWLTVAARSLPSETRYILKPHPAYPIKLSQASSLELTTTEEPLPTLLGNCDVAFTSNITSAAVEAYCLGIPVVQLLDGSSFNLSPLRGMPGVAHITSPQELSDVLRNAYKIPHMAPARYFWVDSCLPRWLNILGLGDAVDRGKTESCGSG